MTSICNLSSVTEFFEGKSVFITGATGFLGKVLVEKLLYSCHGINKIYILTRDKKGYSAEQRLQRLTESSVFQRLKSSRPEDLNKIIPVSGDLTAPGLGLNEEDEKNLLEKVSVVFHAAATINFNEPLRVALNANLEGTGKVLDLCKRMTHIRALVHVSTAYSNTDKKVVEERVYPPPVEIEDVYKFLEKHGDDQKATKRFLNGRPNTYSFTKSLTEAYLAENHGDVATVILRPSIVTAALTEPLPGWVDSWQGNTSVLTATARGFHRVILCDPQAVADLVPVDCVANMAIVAAVRSEKGKMSVYNCCTSGDNPITWQKMVKLFLDASKEDYFHKLPFPGVVMTRSPVVVAILTPLTQTIPAYVMDACRLLMRKRAKFVRLNRQIINLRDQVQFFCSHNWVMKSTKARELAASLSDKDARDFPCDLAVTQWSTYMPLYYGGVKRFLITDKSYERFRRVSCS